MKRALLISCFNWYKTRLRPIRELLICKGYEVTVLVADFDHIKKQTIIERFSECDYIHVPKYKKNISIQRIRSHFSFSKQCKEAINRLKPDLIYCVIPPNLVSQYCADYKSKHPDSILLLDIIDLWPESMPLRKMINTLPAKKWKKWRDDSIKSADHVFTECKLYQEKLNYVIDADKTTTLHLFKEQTEEERKLVQDLISKAKTDDIIRFAYLGSMNNIIDIDGICSVLDWCIKAGKKCELHAIGDGENKEKFEAAVKRIGCKSYFYGPMFDELEKIRLLAPCDFAFNMMKGDVAVGLTIKSIDYFSYGLPIINNIKGDTWKLIESEKIGINVDCLDFNHLMSIDHISVINAFIGFFSKSAFEKVIDAVL